MNLVDPTDKPPKEKSCQPYTQMNSLFVGNMQEKIATKGCRRDTGETKSE